MPASTRHVHRAVPVLALGVLLTGCTATSDGPVPTPTGSSTGAVGCGRDVPAPADALLDPQQVWRDRGAGVQRSTRLVQLDGAPCRAFDAAAVVDATDCRAFPWVRSAATAYDELATRGVRSWATAVLHKGDQAGQGDQIEEQVLTFSDRGALAAYRKAATACRGRVQATVDGESTDWLITDGSDYRQYLVIRNHQVVSVQFSRFSGGEAEVREIADAAAVRAAGLS